MFDFSYTRVYNIRVLYIIMEVNRQKMRFFERENRQKEKYSCFSKKVKIFLKKFVQTLDRGLQVCYYS